MLELRTFGGLSLTANGAPCRGAGARRKTLAVLALLANNKKGLSRDKLIALLWPESDAEHGRNLLRQACFALRRDLRARDVFLGTTELRLNPAVIACDIQQFEDALARGDAANAVAIYAGEFLDGFYLDGADEFERWAGGERSRLHKRACGALETLATGAAAHGDHGTAAERWRRLAELDPLSSRAALGLMTALAALGEVAAALRHGRAYEGLVRQELGAAPEPALSDLLNRLRLETAGAEGINEQELQLATAATGRRRTVGYEKERVALREALHAAISGRGLMVCVAGEPGSGKTTLVEDFLGQVVASGRPCHIARGRCSERLAGSGAYLPLLDALEGLLRGDARGAVTRLLKELAPNWFAQIAPLLPEVAASSANEVHLASQERLKRELNAFLREVCRLRPLIMFLDDVHWVDASTIDILGYVANQMGTAQMLVVTSYRPSELHLAKHPFGPLKLDLQSKGLCREVPLDLLTRADIEQFLTLEFPNHRFPTTLPAFVHAKTEGSPLFMVDLLRYLRAKQVIVADDGSWKLTGTVPDLERELPESVRSMIERKLEQLGDDDRELLASAGVQGYEFDSSVVADVVAMDVGDLEERLEALGRVHGFVRRLRELKFPNGTAAVRYRFVHVLYQNALYTRLAPSRRAALSSAVADVLLEHYPDRSAEIAAELALLFEAARDTARAVEFFTLAAEHAAEVFAQREAVLLAQRGLVLLRQLPDTPERAGRELVLRLRLGFSLFVTQGYADPDAGLSMTRAREICHELGEMPQLFPAIYGLWGFYLVGAQINASHEMAEQMLRMAETAQDPILLFGAHTVMGSSLQHLGRLSAAHEHLERAMELHTPGQHEAYRRTYRSELGCYAGCESLRVLWLLGYPERALRRLDETIALGREASDPQALAFALMFGAILHQHRREAELAQQFAEACITLSSEHGIAAHREWSTMLRGWAIAELGALDEGIALMHDSLAAHRAIRQLIVFPYWLGIYVEQLTKAGRLEEGQSVIREALDVATATDQRFYEGELHRLRGELLMREERTAAEVEACFREAITIARRQQARSLELRAAVSLGRLWQGTGDHREARDLLAPLYSWFAEGFDTADLHDAKLLLAQLA